MFVTILFHPLYYRVICITRKIGVRGKITVKCTELDHLQTKSNCSFVKVYHAANNVPCSPWLEEKETFLRAVQIDIYNHGETVCNQSASSMERCVFSLCHSWWLSRSTFWPDYHRTHTSPECLQLPPKERV